MTVYWDGVFVGGDEKVLGQRAERGGSRAHGDVLNAANHTLTDGQDDNSDLLSISPKSESSGEKLLPAPHLLLPISTSGSFRRNPAPPPGHTLALPLPYPVTRVWGPIEDAVTAWDGEGL